MRGSASGFLSLSDTFCRRGIIQIAFRLASLRVSPPFNLTCFLSRWRSVHLCTHESQSFKLKLKFPLSPTFSKVDPKNPVTDPVPAKCQWWWWWENLLRCEGRIGKCGGALAVPAAASHKESRYCSCVRVAFLCVRVRVVSQGQAREHGRATDVTAPLADRSAVNNSSCLSLSQRYCTIVRKTQI